MYIGTDRLQYSFCYSLQIRFHAGFGKADRRTSHSRGRYDTAPLQCLLYFLPDIFQQSVYGLFGNGTILRSVFKGTVYGEYSSSFVLAIPVYVDLLQ